MKIIDSNDHFSRFVKPFIHKVIYRKQSACRLMIMGCQRSGTTLLSKIFDDSFQCAVFGEYSIFSDQDKYKLRFNPESDVLKKLNHVRSPLVVMKPLVESQNATHWLETIPNSKVLWMIRSPKPVVLSAIKKFGPLKGAINKIRPIVDQTFAKNTWTSWLTEHISEQDKALIERYYSPHMNPLDAGLLFWYLRNKHFLSQDLASSKNVMVIDYDQLINQTSEVLNNIKAFVNMPKLNLNGHYMEAVTTQEKFDCTHALLGLCTDLYLQIID